MLAPIAGLVLTVPAAAGAVLLMPGEPVATLEGGRVLPASMPFPNATQMPLAEGDKIALTVQVTAQQPHCPHLPQIDDGRCQRRCVG